MFAERLTKAEKEIFFLKLCLSYFLLPFAAKIIRFLRLSRGLPRDHCS